MPLLLEFESEHGYEIMKIANGGLAQLVRLERFV